MILTKTKKTTNKRTRKIKSFRVHLFLFSLIILVTFRTIFASFYFALVQYIHDIDWNTLNLEMVVWPGDLPSPLMAIFMILDRNVEQDKTMWTRMTTLAFLLLELSPFVLFEIDFLSALYLEYPSEYFDGRNVEQDETMCHVREWQLCLSYIWHYFPLVYFTLIMHWFRVHSVSRIPFGIFLWYLVEI